MPHSFTQSVTSVYYSMCIYGHLYIEDAFKYNNIYLFLKGLPGPPGEKGENGDVGPMVRCFNQFFFLTKCL